MQLPKMVDMAMSKEEIATTQSPAVAAKASAPLYSYGLCLRLGSDELEKLGLSLDDVVPGDMIHLFAMAKATNISRNASEDHKSDSVELQITHLSVENEDEENDEMDAEEMLANKAKRQKRWYGGSEEA